ncbi:ATP-grasp fold amidoligase family protein [Vagococcus lutrae]|uniref:ATP-grasp fold amidoligase family protein n=1 Tax=Vagococcus lutrae TaxID=81947 RepID=UPI002891CA2F|nr:ATP-grasp fold amidoligase family protein [Vagococcus lutrae]MDT2823842.1 ATP-grasp fold amidoligase family protein [Vagococcus lutrae]
MIKEYLKRFKIWLNYKRYLSSRERYVEKKARKLLGYQINLNNPVTFNEKLQWLKLYWYDERVPRCVDKYEVREYVKGKGLGDLLIPLHGVYDNFEEIDFSGLPAKYVIKVTHNSGGVVVVNESSPLNIDEARKKINNSLSRNYFFQSQEWVYKNLMPRIICEKYIEPEDGSVPKDYKFFCFDGKVKFLFVASDRGTKNNICTTKFDFYTPEWEQIEVEQGYKRSTAPIQKPDNLSDMIRIAEKLSDDFPHVRVDLYNESNKIYFGELTFFHFSGTTKFVPEKYDEIFGEYLNIDNISKVVYADEQ